MESTVFEFDNTLKRNQFTDNLKKLLVVVIDNPKLYLPILISDWYEEKFIMNINILYGKTFSDFEDYIFCPSNTQKDSERNKHRKSRSNQTNL